MANSAGGFIIYGTDEQKKTDGPVRLDPGIDRNMISTEWLEQVIHSGIHRRVSFRLNPVEMSATGKYVYIVVIPQSNWAPHMAADHRYYKRMGTTTVMMEEYEVRDVARRSESPDLSIDLRVRGSSAGSIQIRQ
jgi:predicted HTH transcriptional regulator